MARVTDARSDALTRHPVGVYLAGKIMLTFLVLVASTVVAVNNPQGAYAPRTAFYVVGVAFVVWGASAAGLRGNLDTVRFGWFQLVFDAVLVTALVALTTGVDSPLVVLYFINIIAAPFILPWWGVVSVLALDVAGFAGVAIAGRGGLFPWLIDSHAALNVDDIVLHAFAMALVGMLSVQLTRTMKGMLDRQVQRGEALVEDQANILAELEVGLLELDPAGRIASMNPIAQSVLGEQLGRLVEEVLPGTGSTWEVELPAEDEPIHLLCSRRSRAGGGEMVLIQDVSHLRRIEAVLERDERLAAVGKLAAGLAHEIRNPLASLSGSIQLLGEDARGPLFDIALREVQRLDQLVDEFLDAARPPQLQFERTDLRPILREVAQTFSNDRRYAGRVDIELDLPLELPDAPLDQARVRQVIWNLLLNAAQAMPDRGTITLTVRSRTGLVELRVSDSGVGIPAERLQRIFDPFFTTRTGGTGLGLANVDRIVRGHGGSVSVYSKPGQGTVFMLTFPTGEEIPVEEERIGYDAAGQSEVIEVDG